ncbi:hypothetical protein KUTeg_024812 [Tegillarca granosa]|uniref:HAUS augmin-like complex subunit 6 N-terminal domain-containing protein n=1 Tax=Tegillarca granosa TaxID=220873 RepID=A0ABQ9DYG2_TEGGR|nr:hypothetical protein KUTeg_024812 [Tegillarca granosa]
MFCIVCNFPEKMSAAIDLKTIFFTNLQLLGFDAGAEEARNKIPFNRNMFDLPNKRGAEVVLHFLFSRLNPEMCREQFRDCWPIMDKKGEQLFRRTCNNWLVNITKDEADAHLPRIVASLFLSPGGEKFYQLLFHFSTYVLLHVTSKENDYLRRPILTRQNVDYGDVVAKSLKFGISRHTKKFLEEAQTNILLNREWKDYANELVRDHRRLTKEMREIDHNLRSELHLASERGIARGSPMVKRTKSLMPEYDFDPQATKRSQRVQQVREMWNQLNEFYKHEESEREVIESILDKTLNQHKIDAGEINIKVPDLLLRECEEEIRRVNLYYQYVFGVPVFDSDIKKITNQVHTNNAYLADAKTMQKMMSESLPEIKQSIETLRSQLNSRVSLPTTPQSARTTSIGLGLVEPSPPVSFSPSRETSGKTPKGLCIQASPNELSTPEAAARIAEGIANNIKTKSNKLSQGSPVYAPRMGHKGQPTGGNKIPTKKIPRKTTKQPARTVDVRKQLQSTPTKSVTKDIISVELEPQSWMSRQSKHDQSHSSQKYKNADLSFESTRSYKSGRSQKSEDNDITPVNLSKQFEGDKTLGDDDNTLVNLSLQSGSQSGRYDKGDNHTPQKRDRKSPSDMVADEVMGEGNVLSPVRSGLEAFVSQNLIDRSPPTTQTLQSPRSPSDILVKQILARTPSSTMKSSHGLDSSPIGAEVKKLWKEATSAENSPSSVKSGHSQGSRISKSSRSNQSPRSVQSAKSSNHQSPRYESPRIRNSPRAKTNQPGYLSDICRQELTEIEIKSDQQFNKSTKIARPHSPVAEILEKFQDEEDRPHSPVAEILDSLDKVPSSDALETLTKQEESLSDLTSPRSQLQGSKHDFEPIPVDDVDDEDIQEVPEMYRQERLEKSTLSPQELLVESLWRDTQALITKDIIPRSPISQDIRKMFREALAETDKSSPQTSARNTPRTGLREPVEYNPSSDSKQLSGGSYKDKRPKASTEKKRMKIKSNKSKKELEFNEDLKSDISLDEILRRQDMANDSLGDGNLDDIEMPNLCADGTFDEIFYTNSAKKTNNLPKQSEIHDSIRSCDFDSFRTGSLGDQVPRKQKFPLIDLDFEEENRLLFGNSQEDDDEIIQENRTFRDYNTGQIQLNNEDLQNQNFMFGENKENKFSRNDQLKDVSDKFGTHPGSRDQEESSDKNGSPGFKYDEETVESELLEDINFMNDSNNSLLNFNLSFQKGDKNSSGQKSEDDLDNLDDSVAPLKEGFQLVGASPAKLRLPTNGSAEKDEIDENDIIARFKKLKQVYSHAQ